MNETGTASRTHLYLIGYRGSGKSTVARIVSQQLRLPLVDTDRMVEESAGVTIREIFDQRGEEHFRQLEQAAIEQVSRQSPRVVALGGGAILREANRKRLAASGWTAWLTASPACLAERIAADTATAASRPNLTAQGVLGEVETVLHQRLALYRAAADRQFDTERAAVTEIADEIADWYRRAVAR